MLAGLATTACAQTLAFSISSDTATNGGRQPFLGSSGLYFTLNAPLTVSSLGYWDDGQTDGVTAPLTVAIFDRTSTAAPVNIGGTTVRIDFTGLDGTLVGGVVSNQLDSNPAGPSGRPGQFRLSNLTAPVVLPAGQYALVTWGFNGANQILNGSGDGPVLDITTFGGKLQFDGSAYSDSSATFPATLDPGGGVIIPLYVSGTFSPDAVSAIPEPADVAMIVASAAFGGAFIVRRKKRACNAR